MKRNSLFVLCAALLFGCAEKEIVHTFEIKEIILTAQRDYDNPYKDVDCWVQLTGPDFNKRIYGFWDGGSFVGNEKIEMSLKSTGLLRDPISVVQVKRILKDFSNYDAFL